MLLGMAAIYAGLWARTQIAGAALLESLLLAGMGTGQGFLKVASYQALDRLERPSYYLRTSSPLPFVVFADFGYVCGPLCGHGASAFILWVPGMADPSRFVLSRRWR